MAKPAKVKRAPMAQLSMNVCPTCLRMLGDGSVRCHCDACGCSLDDHRVTMVCTVCDRFCGLDCSPWWVARPDHHHDPTSQ